MGVSKVTLFTIAMLGFGFVFKGYDCLAAKIEYFKVENEGDCPELLEAESSANKVPILAIEPSFFDPEQLVAIRELFERFDIGKLREKYSQPRDIQLRALPKFNVSFSVQSGKIADFGVKFPEENPQQLKDLLKSIFQKFLDRLFVASPGFSRYFDGRLRKGKASFIRYVINANETYPSLQWHRDDYVVQAIVPVRLPQNLKGAHLQLRRRTTSAEGSVIADIQPEENQAVIFFGSRAYHQVTGYELTAGPMSYRDIFTFGLQTRKVSARSAWKATEDKLRQNK